ncbi:hypothetical protein [Blastomonas sp.]|uniref:hypothetical protein n=1 Tax=Blastomonas sp. TaxID=1909299 RepID=UPI00258DC25C|nr:hypothetical protein [Blastomonas sp.]
MIGIAILAPALLATQAAAPVAVPAPPETVAEFLAQADALLAAGNDAAAKSPQADAIRSALQQAAMAYRASLAEAVQRGAPPASCPPHRQGRRSSRWGTSPSCSGHFRMPTGPCRSPPPLLW